MESIKKDQPNHIFKANEGVLRTKNIWLSRLKKFVWMIVGFVILSSIIFWENMFSELSTTSQIMLIVLVLGLTFRSNSYRAPSPFEIWFYDDHLILYREKRYYGNLPRKEYNKFYYNDIERIVHRTETERISIYGKIEGIWYDYNKDGTVPEKPTYHKTTESGLCYFNTSLDPDVDFVGEIEAHSPIKVEVEES